MHLLSCRYVPRINGGIGVSSLQRLLSRIVCICPRLYLLRHLFCRFIRNYWFAELFQLRDRPVQLTAGAGELHALYIGNLPKQHRRLLLPVL